MLLLFMLDFSTFIAAVKKAERSDQYTILAAMYSLGSPDKHLTAAEISEYLDLHMGSNAPTNVNSSLRTYSGLVAPVSRGPIKWILTEDGVKRLQNLSGIVLRARPDSISYDYDIGIVCALEFPEFSAVTTAFSEQDWTEIQDARFTHIYRETRITSVRGQSLKVVGTTSTSMGLTAAAIATTQLIMQFRPRIVVMIGIAAGTKNGGKQFGDILTADPSVDYNSGKVVGQNGISSFQPDPYPIGLNPRLRSVLHKYKGNKPAFNAIRKRWKGEHPSDEINLHIGPLGASDQVIDDVRRIEEIQQNWRKLIGIEMETYAVYRAAEEAPEPRPRAVSFKAVCDFAANKTDSWQEYAAFTAAEFAYDFLKTEWNALWPKS